MTAYWYCLPHAQNKGMRLEAHSRVFAENAHFHILLSRCSASTACSLYRCARKQRTRRRTCMIPSGAEKGNTRRVQEYRRKTGQTAREDKKACPSPCRSGTSTRYTYTFSCCHLSHSMVFPVNELKVEKGGYAAPVLPLGDIHTAPPARSRSLASPPLPQKRKKTGRSTRLSPTSVTTITLPSVLPFSTSSEAASLLRQLNFYAHSCLKPNVHSSITHVHPLNKSQNRIIVPLSQCRWTSQINELL